MKKYIILLTLIFILLCGQGVSAKETFSDGWTTTSVHVRKEPNTDSEILDTYKFNKWVSKTRVNKDWYKIKYKEGYAYINAEYITSEKIEIVNPYTELIEGLSEDEKHTIYQITFLESGNQSMEGQRAVIEVILNRVLSDKYPNDVISVLSQSGQFTTWGYKDSASYNQDQIDALDAVRDEDPVLTVDYLMFSTGKFSYGRNYIQIGAHWFGTF